MSPRQRIAVVGNGSDVGSNIPPLKSGPSIVERLVGNTSFTGLRFGPKAPSKRASLDKCGAMSEQSADSGRGNEQVPQKLVHLVGTRDPSPRQPWVRPRNA
jgi:hypothetical protein